MSDENSEKIPRLNSIEHHNHEDRRRRAKQRLLTSPYIADDNFCPFKKHEKPHQIQFKITPFAEKVGSEVAALFSMSLSQYCKAVLYLNLGLIFEPVDRRRKRK
jgi:hypothetical protein